jgi:hypothetical protein
VGEKNGEGTQTHLYRFVPDGYVGWGVKSETGVPAVGSGAYLLSPLSLFSSFF